MQAILVTCATALSADAQDYGADKPPPVIPEVAIPLTDAERAQLKAIDARIVGVEAIAEKIDDPAYKEATVKAIVDLKKRKAALERKFDPGLAEALMHSVISRYQMIALWLRPAPLPATAARTRATDSPPKAKAGS